MNRLNPGVRTRTAQVLARRTRRSSRLRHRGRALAAIGLAMASIAVTTVNAPATAAPTAPVGNGFVVTAGDLSFILKQIKIAERHSATFTDDNPCGTLIGPASDQVPDALTAYGLRTVDGSCNNLFPGRETFAAADVPFPHLAAPIFRDAEPIAFQVSPDPVGTPTSYNQFTPGNVVFDSQPRTASNLIVDQTSTNPAAIAAAGFPVRSQGNRGSVHHRSGPGRRPPRVFPRTAFRHTRRCSFPT